MQRKSRLSIDPVLITGILLSVGLATAFYFYSELAVTIATFAGLLGIVITLQVQEITRERRPHPLAVTTRSPRRPAA